MKTNVPIIFRFHEKQIYVKYVLAPLVLKCIWNHPLGDREFGRVEFFCLVNGHLNRQIPRNRHKIVKPFCLRSNNEDEMLGRFLDGFDPRQLFRSTCGEKGSKKAFLNINSNKLDRNQDFKSRSKCNHSAIILHLSLDK